MAVAELAATEDERLSRASLREAERERAETHRLDTRATETQGGRRAAVVRMVGACKTL